MFIPLTKDYLNLNAKIASQLQVFIQFYLKTFHYYYFECE